HRPTRLCPSFPTRRSSDLSAPFAFWAQARGAAISVIAHDSKIGRVLIFASAAFIAFTSLVSPCAWSAHDPQGWLYGPREVKAMKDRKSTRLNSSHVAISYA